MGENMVQMDLFGGERPGKPGHRDNPAVPKIPPPLPVEPEPNMVRVAPNTILLDLDSWYRHLADCMDNPDRWNEGGEDRETYLQANGLGGWKRFV